MDWRRKAVTGLLFLASALLVAGCRSTVPATEETVASEPPSILLVTLDTTRADRVGFEYTEVETPSLDALAARGVRFSQAYTTAPMTLPAHASMLTGLYPSEHGVHENARFLTEDHALLASQLKKRGYSTAAFVSGLPLSRQFGLARGFDHYDDDFGAAMFVRGEYRRSIPVFERVLEQDPENLMVTLRLAVAHSILGRDSQASALFARAENIDAGSLDLRLYRALHHLRFRRWEEAEPLLEGVLIQMPERLPALEAWSRFGSGKDGSRPPPPSWIDL